MRTGKHGTRISVNAEGVPRHPTPWCYFEGTTDSEGQPNGGEYVPHIYEDSPYLDVRKGKPGRPVRRCIRCNEIEEQE